MLRRSERATPDPPAYRHRAKASIRLQWGLTCRSSFSPGRRDFLECRERGLPALRNRMAHRRCVDAPRNDTGSGNYQELVTVLVDDPVRSPATSRPGRTAHYVTIFWCARCRGHRCNRLDLSGVSHQFGKRYLIFAHLCDYFSEDDFGLALSSDVQLILKCFALREQFFKGGHFRLHYKKSFFEVVWMFNCVLINEGRRRVFAF